MITILIGKSAAGKDTMFRKYIKSGSKPIVLYTSRPKREGELEGKEYHFVSKDKFISLIQNGTFMEYRSYITTVGGIKDTWYYGTPWINPEAGDYVVVLEVQAATKFLEIYGSDKCKIIYIIADDKVREKRAKKRKSFDQKEWDRRLLTDADDFSDEKISALVELCSFPLTFYDNNPEKE